MERNHSEWCARHRRPASNPTYPAYPTQREVNQYRRFRFASLAALARMDRERGTRWNAYAETTLKTAEV